MLLSLDSVYLAPFLLLQSMVCFGPVIFVLDFLRLGLLLLLQSHAHMDSAFSTFQRSRFESSFPTSDFTHLDFSSSLRSFAHMDSAFSAFSCSRFDFLVFFSDYVLLGSLLSVRSSAWMGLTVPPLDSLHLDPILPLQSLA